MCFGDFLPMRTPHDAYHKEFESHKRSILDISDKRNLEMFKELLLNDSFILIVFLLICQLLLCSIDRYTLFPLLYKIMYRDP